MTVHVLDERDGIRFEVCDHEGTAEAIDTPEIEGVRCAECECTWWRNKAGPHLPDLTWLSPFPRLIAISERSKSSV